MELRLEHILALPTIGRSARGIETRCSVCYQPITEELFYVGFMEGQPNRLFHFGCLDELSQTLIEYPDCQVCKKPCEPGSGILKNGNYVHKACDVK